MELPLTSLKNGETAVIQSTDCRLEGKKLCRNKTKKGCNKKFANELCIKRLTDLGLTPGTKVTVIKSAPFNGPLEISVRGSRLAIGRGMASRILVDVER
ncbi:MAG: ferrous iron transport protein A [Candidatus Bathyarchaeota archaeon]|nr:ferrous iron transport protein A [Candidatus Bathyarchaeum sp.]